MFLRNYYPSMFRRILDPYNSAPGIIYNHVKNIAGLTGAGLKEINSNYSMSFPNPNFYDLFGKTLDGDKYNKVKAAENGVCYNSSTDWYGSGFILGTGNTPVTIDDYCLSGSAIPSTDYTFSYTQTFGQENGYRNFSVAYTITNISANPITIGEMGVGEVFAVYDRKYYTSWLVYREALETPITIEPGGVGQINITINSNIPV